MARPNCTCSEYQLYLVGCDCGAEDTVTPTFEETDFLRRVEEEAQYGDPLLLEPHEAKIATSLIAKGWLRGDEDEVYLTEAGSAAIASEGR